MTSYDELQTIAKEIKPESSAEFIGYLKAMKIEHDKKEAEIACAPYTTELADKTISQARARCYTKSNAQFESYGAAGVIIANEFLESKELFRDYLMSLEGYGEAGFRIDRINLAKGYVRDNIRWALKSECNEIKHSFPGGHKAAYVFFIPNTDLEFRTDDFNEGAKWLSENYTTTQ